MLASSLALSFQTMSSAYFFKPKKNATTDMPIYSKLLLTTLSATQSLYNHVTGISVGSLRPSLSTVYYSNKQKGILILTLQVN